VLEPNRLFFALWPDEATRQAVQQAAKTLKVKMQPSGYLSNAERYHLTLHFLGDFVSADNQAAAFDAAAQVRAAPFTLSLEIAGSFRNARIPWWLAPRQTPPELAALHREIHDRLLHARVLPERMKFVPHLTILRDAGCLLPATPVPAIAWKVEEFVLVRSRLDLKPVRYDLIGRWPLTGAEAPPEPLGQMNLWDN
jgi:RNA 2',3'-cyclic 3'-phosphodiesterase